MTAAIDAWELAAQKANADATVAASATAQATTAQQTADASAALSDEKQATAKAEAQKLSDMFTETPPGFGRRRRS